MTVAVIVVAAAIGMRAARFVRSGAPCVGRTRLGCAVITVVSAVVVSVAAVSAAVVDVRVAAAVPGARRSVIIAVPTASAGVVGARVAVPGARRGAVPAVWRRIGAVAVVARRLVARRRARRETVVAAETGGAAGRPERLTVEVVPLETVAAAEETEVEDERRTVSVAKPRVPPAGSVINRDGRRAGVRIGRVDLVGFEHRAGTVTGDRYFHTGRKREARWIDDRALVELDVIHVAVVVGDRDAEGRVDRINPAVNGLVLGLSVGRLAVGWRRGRLGSRG